VFKECFPKNITDTESFLKFNYNFNILGYLPYFIPTIANFGRTHNNQISQKITKSGNNQLWIRNYLKKIKKYKRKLIFKIIKHKYRNGNGEILSYKFSIKRLIEYMIIPANIITNIAMFVNTRLYFIYNKFPRFYNFGREIYHNYLIKKYG
jgi:hypothetical protein